MQLQKNKVYKYYSLKASSVIGRMPFLLEII